MNRFLTILATTAVIFILLTLLTSKNEIPFDGNNTYGFPFTFYKKYGGKRTFYPSNEFKILYLFVDIACAALISTMGLAIFKKFNKHNNL